MKIIKFSIKNGIVNLFKKIKYYRGVDVLKIYNIDSKEKESINGNTVNKVFKIYKIGSKGANVKEIQATLNKLGLYEGDIDGIFGVKTEDGIKKLQKLSKVLPTGVVDYYTSEVLEKFILGHDTSMDIVNTNIDYTYEIMKKNIKGLKIRYPFIEVGSIGKSILGKELYYIKLGNGENKVFYNGAHHAIEWITSLLLMKFVENYLKAYIKGEKILNYDVNEIWSKSSIYIVPMVNPDGVDLVIDGLKENNLYYYDLIKWNKGNTDFSKKWSANIRGVDLNHNYDASWAKGKMAEKEYGIYGPGPTRYSGIYPESEPETKAVADFTRKNDFKIVIAYHSQGEVIYWDYMNMASKRAKEIGELFSRLSGYELEEAHGMTSYSGYKDWFIEKFKRPGYTIEIGKGINPLPTTKFTKIYNDNIRILLEGAVLN
ncbi:gamma-D-glutamyl-L-diamino acid endopeptidase 1 [Clostridium tepidiprofundi DSM 19306]|uniref:Gamma-D-glutamyl-L-diamino acid endopeptidase 1 n=1 Tax=Clostridium tepidiprofundi DSM 19306 TaxID=1121338 RepID=A0A151B4C5_9CLOT|nr:gamma-D-glutamyl-L-diamino acid endopeptidase 1 [Clostridium tepidiprofundi DSM 19306]